MKRVLYAGALFACLSTAFVVESKESPIDYSRIIDKLKNETPDCLKGEKIVLTCTKAPNEDVPSYGFGDAFLYLRVLTDKLEKLGAEVAICPPAPLRRFFEKCSDMNIIREPHADENYTAIDCRDALDNIKDIHKFKCTKRYINDSERCAWARNQVKLIQKNVESQIREKKFIPVLFTRAASTVPRKYATDDRFKYMTKRSISRDDLTKMLSDKPAQVRVFSQQFEDKRLPLIKGTERGASLDNRWNNHYGPFVTDALFMAALLRMESKKLSWWDKQRNNTIRLMKKAKLIKNCDKVKESYDAEVATVDTAAGNLAFGLADQDDKRKNVRLLVAKDYNSRWKGQFRKENGDSTWSENLDIISQDEDGDWSAVGRRLNAKWAEKLND